MDAGQPGIYVGYFWLRSRAMRKVVGKTLGVFTLLAIVVTVAGFWAPSRTSAAATICSTRLMNIVAHEDDDLLFLSPDLLHAIQSGWCVRTVYVTAGDAGLDESYWQSRANGEMAAYAEMAGVPDNWSQTDAGIAGHTMPLYTLTNRSNVSLVFMRLPDGNGDGTGFPATNYESLQKLWTGGISTIHAVDGTSAYTRQELISVLTSLMQDFQPSQIHTHDYTGSFGESDHSDHYATAYFALAAHHQYTLPHTLTGYEGYATKDRPQNVFGADLTAKQNAFFTYTPYDVKVCQSASACAATDYSAWLARQYTVGSETGGTSPPSGESNLARTAAATASSQNTATGQTADKAIDGVAAGYPGDYTKEWATTYGGVGSWLKLTWPGSVTLSRVVLYDRPNLEDQITAATLTFSDGSTVNVGMLPNAGSALSVSFPTRTTTSLLLTVTSVSGATLNIGLAEIETWGTASIPSGESNLARTAAAAASSQNTATGQTADKAIDGVAAGYPGDYTKEWATTYGGVGSWLKLTWPGSVTLSRVVLYDRPNLEDQITAATLTFSDGSTVNVGMLPNAGSALSVSFPTRTTTSLLLTVTSVSGATLNIGLAEIETWGTA